MKITFEGQSMLEIVAAMEHVVADYRQLRAQVQDPFQAKPETDAVKPVEKPVQKPVEKPVDNVVSSPVEVPREKPAKPARSEKQQAVVAKMRAAREAKKAAKATVDAALGMPMPPPPKTAEGMDPASLPLLREKVLEDLRMAYGNGYQNEVMELLARFGNGAKSFRELGPEAFVPIREAIDNGALT
jgi:hypothetical protein